MYNIQSVCVLIIMRVMSLYTVYNKYIRMSSQKWDKSILIYLTFKSLLVHTNIMLG